MPEQATEVVRLSALTLKSANLEVDREKGIVRNLSIISMGVAKGHGFHIDKQFAQEVHDAINAESKGSKSRFGHPQILADGTGKVMGRIKNASFDGDKVRADLHLGEYAKNLPGLGNVWDYVLGLAEGDPEAHGMSISFVPSEFRQDFDEGLQYPSLGRLIAVDFVDDPAANSDGMLSEPKKTLDPGNSDRSKTMPQDDQKQDKQDKGTDLSQDNKGTDLKTPPADKPEPQAPQPTQLSADDAKRLAEEAVKLERKRVEKITSLGTELNLGQQWITEHVKAETSIDDAKDAALLASAKRQAAVPNIVVGEDLNVSSLGSAITDALMIRGGSKLENPHERSREFRGLSLLDTGRVYLKHNGIDPAGLSRMELATVLLNPNALAQKFGATAFNLSLGSGSFTSIMADVMGKTLRSSYDEQAPTWSQWARRASAPDFKDIKRTMLSEAPDLEQIGVNGEIKYATLTDTQETYALIEYGHIIPLTRRAIINDDMDALSRIPQLQGRAAVRKEDDVAYAILLNNANMADGTALFDSGHGNLAGSGGAISVTTLGAARQAMRIQKGLQDKARLGLRPRHLLVTPENETIAEQVLNSLYDTSTSNDTMTTNPFHNKLNLIVEERLSDTDFNANATSTNWYIAADNNQVDTVEVCFLEDEPAPVFDTEIDFDTEGAKMKVRHTVAAKAIDHRGLYKNPGA